MSKERLQEKYILYQLLQQNLESMREQLELVERQFIEVKTTEQVLNDLKKRKGSDDVLVPLGSGYYGNGKVVDVENVLVNLGANVMINKKLNSANVFLKEREKELERASKEIQEHMSRVVDQINKTAVEIQKLAREK